MASKGIDHKGIDHKGIDRKDIAIVVNTCPKYFYILEAFFGLLRRYGDQCAWPVYLATEEPEQFHVKRICKQYSVNILPLKPEESDFLESRLAAVCALPKEVQYILPLQEDFLLERPGLNYTALESALSELDERSDLLSVRLMPCPASSERPGGGCKGNPWIPLGPNDLLFSYQATIWRREVYEKYIRLLIQNCLEANKELKPQTPEWNRFCVRVNPAETGFGMDLFKRLYPGGQHVCWTRKGAWANAVYWCPWPYRPTAIVQGVLQPWAAELIKREGFALQSP
jgi:hypothetical protein